MCFNIGGCLQQVLTDINCSNLHTSMWLMARAHIPKYVCRKHSNTTCSILTIYTVTVSITVPIGCNRF